MLLSGENVTVSGEQTAAEADKCEPNSHMANSLRVKVLPPHFSFLLEAMYSSREGIPARIFNFFS